MIPLVEALKRLRIPYTTDEMGPPHKRTRYIVDNLAVDLMMDGSPISLEWSFGSPVPSDYTVTIRAWDNGWHDVGDITNISLSFNVDVNAGEFGEFRYVSYDALFANIAQRVRSWYVSRRRNKT